MLKMTESKTNLIMTFAESGCFFLVCVCQSGRVNCTFGELIIVRHNHGQTIMIVELQFSPNHKPK